MKDAFAGVGVGVGFWGGGWGWVKGCEVNEDYGPKGAKESVSIVLGWKEP